MPEPTEVPPADILISEDRLNTIKAAIELACHLTRENQSLRAVVFTELMRENDRNEELGEVEVDIIEQLEPPIPEKRSLVDLRRTPR